MQRPVCLRFEIDVINRLFYYITQFWAFYQFNKFQQDFKSNRQSVLKIVSTKLGKGNWSMHRCTYKFVCVKKIPVEWQWHAHEIHPKMKGMTYLWDVWNWQGIFRLHQYHQPVNRFLYLKLWCGQHLNKIRCWSNINF